MKEKTVLTFGTFDLFHFGHLRMLERAREMGTRLIVGVSSDAFNFAKKKKKPVFSENERLGIIKALRVVDDVFLEESLEEKANYVRRFKADVLVMGDDWEGKFDWVEQETGCKVVYLQRTPSISTTALVEKIQGGL
ncbi:MAG TPA: adenylyltransferase/cytidyltransferase family protein [Candidatus Thermoplasmatota archaeon]|nr:adenylyltransferase/cytidyltransferase family protein [Candidatus Thermoplasmatota archaeon]